MDKLEELKNQLKALSQEEAESLKEFFEKEMVYSPEHAQEEAAEVIAEKGNEVAEIKGEIGEVNERKALEETLPAETKEEAGEEVEAAKTEEKLEEVPEIKSETEATEEEVKTPEAEQIPTPEPTYGDIPQMQKGVAPVEEGEEAVPNSNAQLTAETGEQLPIDYEQIIEGQNAKIAALQAENASLKTKVEGAFGYSAKPANSVKVNRLYDDATDVHFRR